MNSKSVLNISSDGECGNVPKHAATPWHHSANQICSGDRLEICEMLDGERKANARFICKAVNAHDELVAAFQKLLDYADDSDGSQYGTLSTSLIRDIANTALARVKE